LTEFIISHKIKAVFVETSVGDVTVKSLVEGCERRNHKLAIGQALLSDSTGEPGTPEGNYVGTVRHNLKAIVDALR
jgi:manganese/zinc/iron transport system substrate-binding protein